MRGNRPLPAIAGGSSVRNLIDNDAIAAVVKALKSNHSMTTTERQEQALARCSRHGYTMAVPRGTAELPAAVPAAGIGPGGEPITSGLARLAAEAGNLYLDGASIVVEIDRETPAVFLLEIEQQMTPRTRTIGAVQ